MAVNLELLNSTLARIKELPQEYRQSTWVSQAENNVCGTTMCFAGHAAVLAGAEIPNPKKHSIVDWFVAEDENNSYLNLDDAYYSNGDTPNQHVQDFATKALGLTYKQREYLFEADRTMDQIEQAVHELNTYGEILSYDDDPCECGCEDDDYYEDYDGD